MLHIVLFQPDIPQNTGNVGRLCAVVKARLHLIHPLGFVIDDKHLRRAGMDYWHNLDVVEHENWQAFSHSALGPSRLFLLTTHATKSFWDAHFCAGDGLVFGKETQGAPPWLHAAVDADKRLMIDKPNQAMRSLNLATAAGIATYEVLRQWRHTPVASS